MTATWTAPRTWATNDLITAALLNQHLRDNLEALKTPPTAHYEMNEAADITLSSTTWADVSTKFNLTITTSGGDILVGFCGAILAPSTGLTYFDIMVDGVAVSGDDGMILIYEPNTASIQNASFTRLLTGYGSGSHTIKLRYKRVTANSTLYAGAGTATLDLHPQFWVREV